MAHFNLIVVLVASLACFTLAEEKYSSEFENFDVDKVLNDDSLLTSYINCFLDEGKCTEEAQVLKRVIPDALKTNCRKCTDSQKSQIEKYMKFLIKNRPADLGRLDDKYNPLGEYKTNLEKFSA